MKSKKIVGWAVFAAGILMILFSVYASYNIFTAKAAAPEIFKPPLAQEPETAAAPEAADPASLQEMQEATRKAISEEIGKLIPGEFLPKLLNLASWSIFAGILFLAGGRLASLGIQLLKD